MHSMVWGAVCSHRLHITPEDNMQLNKGMIVASVEKAYDSCAFVGNWSNKCKNIEY